MLPERLREYLELKGLAAEDVPKIATAWVACKYTTKACLVLGCIRYQPLSQLFRRVYRPINERARARALKENAQLRELHSPSARQLLAMQRRRVRFAAWKDRWYLRLRLQAELHRKTLARVRPGVFERIAAEYRSLAAKKSQLVARSQWFAAFARAFTLEPRQLALGAAEGMILGVVLAPLYYPLWFLLCVRFFQRRSSEVGYMTEFEDLQTMVEAELTELRESGLSVRGVGSAEEASE